MNVPSFDGFGLIRRIKTIYRSSCNNSQGIKQSCTKMIRSDTHSSPGYMESVRLFGGVIAHSNRGPLRLLHFRPSQIATSHTPLFFPPYSIQVAGGANPMEVAQPSMVVPTTPLQIFFSFFFCFPPFSLFDGLSDFLSNKFFMMIAVLESCDKV